MSDLRKYVEERKKKDRIFAHEYEEGYEQFKVGMILREARESAGLTQDEVARRLKTKKTAISRIENHAEDIKLSTLERFASALGKKLTVGISSYYENGIAEAKVDYKIGRTKKNILKFESKIQRGEAKQDSERTLQLENKTKKLKAFREK
jgi:transcriptional regulator with XRE-family HTH domain